MVSWAAPVWLRRDVGVAFHPAFDDNWSTAMAEVRKLSKYGRLHPGDVNVPHRKLVLFAADTPNSWKPAAVLEELKVRTGPFTGSSRARAAAPAP